MLKRTVVALMLLFCMPAWYGDGIAGCNVADAQMLTPPPVSGRTYPVVVGADRRNNYLELGITLGGAYIDNLYAGTTAKPLHEMTYSVLPAISFDQTGALQHLRFTYRPGFTFYTPTSELNEVDQNAGISYRRRFSPHTAIRMQDNFEDSSATFGLNYAGLGGTVSGGALISTPGVIPPFAQRLTNSSRVDWNWQTGPVSMIGVAGTGEVLSYPNPAESTGLYDSNVRGGSAFYSRMISRNQYLGAQYEYAYSIAEVPKAEIDVQAHTFAGFYTVYPLKHLSLSLMGGPEHYEVSQSPSLRQSAWVPSVSVSLGHQGQYSNVAISYSQSVTGGGGIAGAFNSKSANATVQLRVARPVTVGFDGGYADNAATSLMQFVASSSGHSITGSVSVGYAAGQHLNVMCKYERIHEHYDGILSIRNNPDSDRLAVMITWHATHPFGR